MTTLGERAVVRLRARQRASPVAFDTGTSPQPAEVEVLIDAEVGYLHSMTGLFQGEPYHVVEFVDLVLTPSVDEDAFTVDSSKIHVVEPEEWQRDHRPSLSARLRSSLRWHHRRPNRRRRWRRRRRAGA